MDVLIWNPSKAEGATTVEALRAFEVKEDGSVSSWITVTNMEHLKSTLNAIYNETDVSLHYMVQVQGNLGDL